MCVGRGGGGVLMSKTIVKQAKEFKGRFKSFPRLKPVLNWANVSARS